MMNDDDSQMIFGNLWGLNLPDICLTGQEKLEKTSLRKLVPTRDRTGPAARQARMLPPVPQRWTIVKVISFILCMYVCVCVCACARARVRVHYFQSTMIAIGVFNSAVRSKHIQHFALFLVSINIFFVNTNISYKTERGRRVIGISGSLIWSKTLMELIFNPCDGFRLSPEGPVSHIYSPHLLVGAPGTFQIF